MSEERAVLAGGCFWGVQDLLRTYPGVISTRVGYTGGNTPNATYRNHGYHAEGVEVLFDPAKMRDRRARGVGALRPRRPETVFFWGLCPPLSGPARAGHTPLGVTKWCTCVPSWKFTKNIGLTGTFAN